MRRALTSALIGGAAASGSGTIKLNWSDCGDSSTHGHITSLSPTSVTLGTKTTISGKGKVDEAIPGATFKVVAKEGFIPIFSHTGDACKPDTIKLPAGAGEIDMKGFKCPLSPGAAELDLDLSLSSSIPAKLARITIELTAQTSSGDKALCVQIKTSPESLIADGDNLVPDPVLDYSSYNFETYVKEFGKNYGDDESQRRQSLFETNLARIVAHNQEYKDGKHTWYASVNHLTDYTAEEFAKLRATNYNPSTHPILALGATAPNPKSIDWREKGAVTKVKNQGGCGSCWAFSATETVESAYAIASGGKLLELAPQTYVNCVKNPNKCGGTGGCQGATMELAFNLTAQTGIALESDLPYAGQNEPCSNYKAAVKVAGYVKNPVNDAKALETAVATKGPQAITVAAGSWSFYGGGVFHGCSSGGDATLDHGVQLVGYTPTYWIVRNSWGAGWGENGYIYISRASDAKTFTDSNPADGVACYPYPKKQIVGGECGILFDTSYPTGAKAADENVIV